MTNSATVYLQWHPPRRVQTGQTRPFSIRQKNLPTQGVAQQTHITAQTKATLFTTPWFRGVQKRTETLTATPPTKCTRPNANMLQPTLEHASHSISFENHSAHTPTTEGGTAERSAVVCAAMPPWWNNPRRSRRSSPIAATKFHRNTTVASPANTATDTGNAAPVQQSSNTQMVKSSSAHKATWRVANTTLMGPTSRIRTERINAPRVRT